MILHVGGGGNLGIGFYELLLAKILILTGTAIEAMMT